MKMIERPALCTVLFAVLVAIGCSEKNVGQGQASGAATPISAASLPSDDDLRATLDEVIDFTGNRNMSVEQHAAWQVVHGILAYRDLKIYAQGELVTALDYLLAGGVLNGWTMRPGDHGLIAVVESGTKTGQGHQDQWLGYLSQVGLRPDQTVVVAGKSYTVADLISQAQWDLYDGMEATWTLMAFSTYLPLDAKWTAKDGSEWTIDRLAGMEAAQDLSQSACGGAHRLYALTTAVNRCLAEGRELTPGFKAADDKIQDSIAKARMYQQSDGLLSTMYFQRGATSPDAALRMSTTGHVLEFLTLALNDQQIHEPWVKAAVVKLCELFKQTKDFPMECGALYHAARGLQLYRYRVYGPRQAPSVETTTEPTVTDATPDDSTAAKPAQVEAGAIQK